MAAEDVTKKCSKCGELLPFSCFSHRDDGKLKLTSSCKACLSKKSIDYFKKASEEIRNRRRERQRKIYAENPDIKRKSNERAIRWEKENPERVRINHANRRAWKKLAAGKFTKKQFDDLFQKQRGRCAYCTKKLEKYHLDHITPLSRGGSGGFYNLQLLCPTCNLQKSSKDPIVHAQSLGRLL